MEQRNTEPAREDEAPILRIDCVEDAFLPTEWDGQGEFGGPSQPDNPGFCIRDDDVADWAVGIIVEARREYIRIKELADREIARINAKVEQAWHRMEADTDYLTACLADYASTVTPSKVTKTGSTYKLLHGTLRRRAGGLDYRRDEDQLLAWLQETGNADLINAALALWKPIRHVTGSDRVAAQAWMRKMLELGLTWDAISKQYVQAPAEKEA